MNLVRQAVIYGMIENKGIEFNKKLFNFKLILYNN
jgi:hypothetical protein